MTPNDKLVKFLRDNRPHAFCPGCLGLEAGMSLQDARAMVSGMQRLLEEFMLQAAQCHRCGRSMEVLAAR
jgi:hypothetical protein